MTSSHSEIDRLMAEADDMIAFGVTIGIDPDDDSEEAQRRLTLAWERHCAKVARNEGGKVMERTLEQFETEDLLRELRLREDVAIASWSVEDIEDEIEYRANHRGLELTEDAPVSERAAGIIKNLRDRLESAMIEATFEMIADEAELAVDDFLETEHAVEEGK